MITSRQKQLLAKIIDIYRKNGYPISSKLIESEGFCDLSSASIRAEMNELERLGYLEQPHTSSGRIPTDKAYRYYVDVILDQKDAEEENHSDRARVEQAVRQAKGDPQTLTRQLAAVLAQITEQVVITHCNQEDHYYKHGLAHLLRLPEFQQFDQAFRLARFFDQFEDFYTSFQKMQAYNQPYHLYIGRENLWQDMNDEAIIVGQYKLPQGGHGMLVMVGPMRMDYERNIALVEDTIYLLNTIAQDYE